MKTRIVNEEMMKPLVITIITVIIHLLHRPFSYLLVGEELDVSTYSIYKLSSLVEYFYNRLLIGRERKFLDQLSILISKMIPNVN